MGAAPPRGRYASCGITAVAENDVAQRGERLISRLKGSAAGVQLLLGADHATVAVEVRPASVHTLLERVNQPAPELDELAAWPGIVNRFPRRPLRRALVARTIRRVPGRFVCSMSIVELKETIGRCT